MQTRTSARKRNLCGNETRSPIAIIVPVYKHSALFLEAIASLRASTESGDARIVIVDDGCPYFQTMFSGSLAVREGIHYIRQINRGLSGARNCGIDFVLRHLPECEGLYFLDADNKLSGFSVDRFQQLLQDNPKADWFYPDVVMTGIRWSGDFSGPFRRLTQTLQNISEAGSLVRRRVFSAGCRFDEKMRAGYEDWEFWISLMEQGFLGCHMPGSGFLYRKRAESMLAESERRHNEIVDYIENKHPWVRDISTLLELEHRESPRFAIIRSESSTVLIGTDPTATREITIQAYSRLLRLSLERPNWASAGAIMVFASDAVLQQLASAGILNAIFWRAEVELKENNFVSIVVGEASDDFLFQSKSENLATSDLLFVKMSLMRAILLDSGDSWISQIVQSPETIGCVGLDIRAPQLREPARSLRRQNSELYEFVRRERRQDVPRLWSGRAVDKGEGTPDVSMLPARIQDKFGRGVLPCRIAAPGVLSVAMILPIMEFGGVEKVALNVAREFRRRGFRVDFIIYGNKRAYDYCLLGDAYDQIYILDYIQQDYGGAVYEGTHLPSNISRQHPEIRNLLQSYDVAINCHAAGVLHHFADLRRSGVVTVNYLHLIEYTKKGRGVGHPVIGLAFEHSTDLVACCSHQIAAQVAALGIPREKILEVPNGPGAVITPAVANDTAKLRELPGAHGPLRVIYLGRLDVQKGLDRLNDIAAVLRQEANLFQLRIVGGRVVDTEVEGAGISLDNEPPVYTDTEVVELYQWADVVIMPSRFEGLPLTIIEAMTLGVVPIVTDVGAVSEVVKNCENGYIVTGENVADQMIELIRCLEADRDMLRRISRNAQSAAAMRSWTSSAGLLIDRVDAILRRRPQRRSMHFDFTDLHESGKPGLPVDASAKTVHCFY
jgi:glycosyltransferase involved in cell wall biosynthesis/GT2 family glycosyltransferase